MSRYQVQILKTTVQKLNLSCNTPYFVGIKCIQKHTITKKAQEENKKPIPK